MLIRILLVITLFNTNHYRLLSATGCDEESHDITIDSDYGTFPDQWRLAISEDGMRIQKSDGTDWFWLGDTGWSLFQELNREDAEFYFSTRASQGFTVIQAVIIMGWNRGWNDKNAYGHSPFHNGEVSNPNVEFWNHADWLDFNMQQSSHGKRNIRADNRVDLDLSKEPTKPTLNGEPNYEDHCIGWKQDCSEGTFNAHDVRQLAYWTVFAGATGITYGHVHVWDFFNGGNHEDGYQDWKGQLKDSGAVQMGFLANLMMSRPHTGRAPAQHILTNEYSGGLKQRAISGNGYAFVYTSQGNNIHLNLDQLPWRKIRGWWFNPRDGQAIPIEEHPDTGQHNFNPPGRSGADNDWVLVIDDASKDYAEPGKRNLRQ
jgi:hypothetical protein